MVSSKGEKGLKFVFLFTLLFSSFSNASYCLIELNNGNLRIDSVSVNSCPSGLALLTTTELENINDELVSQNVAITAFDIGESFIWGFGTYIGFWFMGYSIKTARGTIKQV